MSELIDQLHRAGAGAGKTTGLTEYIISAALAFKQKHRRFPRFVVTTFTRKATQELKERLMLKADELGDPEVLQFVSSGQYVFISTIHGVLSLFLSRVGHRLGLDPAFQILDSAQTSYLSKKILYEALQSNPEAQLLLETFGQVRLEKMLDEFSRALLACPDMRPISIEDMMLYLEQEKEELHLLAKELLPKIENEATKGAWQKFIPFLQEMVLTLNSKNSDLPFQMKKPPYGKNTGISEETNALTVKLKSKVEDWNTLLDEKNRFSSFEETMNVFSHLAHKYHELLLQEKKTKGRLAMSDLELLALEGLRQDPSLSDSFAKEWDYWFIDEYQDTSPIQEELLRKLKGNSPSYVVGDPQQSIYLFRGARSEVFLNQEKELLDRGDVVTRMTNNYRSHPQLVEFFNLFFSQFMDHDFQKMIPQVEDISLGLKTEARIQLLEAENEEKEILGVSQWISKLINEGVRPEEICVLSATNRSLKKVAQKLYEMNIPRCLHASGGFQRRREILDAMALLKFILNPHDTENLLLLLRTPFLRMSDDVLAQYASKKQSSSLWSSIENNPEDSSCASPDDSLDDNPEGNSGDAKKKTTDFEQMSVKQKLRELLQVSKTEGIFRSFVHGLTALHVFDLSSVYDPSGQRESNLWKLIYLLEQEMRKPDFNFFSFIDRYQKSESEKEESDAIAASEPQRVNLMTIHASKGLQFKHVIVTRLSKKRKKAQREAFCFSQEAQRWTVGYIDEETGSISYLPLITPWITELREREKEEELRLYYVAMTRAQESLFLSWTKPFDKDSFRSLWTFEPELGLQQWESVPYVLQQTVSEVASASLEKKKVQVRDPWGGDDVATLSLRSSVTSLLAQSNESASSKIRTFKPAQFLGLLQKSFLGTAVHRLFEIRRYYDDTKVREICDLWFEDKSQEVWDAYEFVLKTERIPMLELLQQGHAEWGFILNHEGHQIEGQIDLWGVHNGQVYILDYKTGNFDYVEKAFDQLKIYSLAIRKIHATEAINLVAVFPFDRKIEIRKL